VRVMGNVCVGFSARFGMRKSLFPLLVFFFITLSSSGSFILLI
jgi:hypothetical protein